MANDNLVPPPVPVPLSGQLLQVMQSGLSSDIDINGIPFLLKPSQQDPLVRQITDGLKDQFDSSKEAGENSFGVWWLRSQSTFHGGQGQTYIDSSAADEAVLRSRFDTSTGLYPHVAGQLTIAGKVTSTVATRSKTVQVTWSGVQKLVTIDTSSNKLVVENLPALSGGTNVTLGATGVAQDITSDGANVYAAINGDIYKVAPGGAATKIYTGFSFSGNVVLGFAKQRLILAIARVLYELDPNAAASSPPPAAKYTNPSTGYQYTAITEGTTGIFVAGFSGPNSDVASMSVTESGASVVLGPPVVQMRTPPGEIVNDLFFYVSTFFCVATTNGIRVGTFTPYAQPQLGALLPVGPTYCATGSGTLIWVGGQDSIWTVDLSTPLDQSGLYAHAKYASGVGATGTDPVNDLTVYPATPDLVFGTCTSGRLLSQPSYTPATTATFTTSWVRFDTTEPKRLHYVSLEGVFPMVAGVTNVASVTVEASTGQTKTFNIEGGTQTSIEFSTGAALPSAQAYRLTVTLRDNSTGHGVLLRSWQMKALPMPARFSELVYPLILTDEEKPSSGAARGYRGFAKDRLGVLMGLAETNDVVTVRDSILGNSYQASIERIQFRQELAPTHTNGVAGVVNVILRAV